jgi:hypothetical protein
MLNQILSNLSGKPVKERMNERCLGYLREHAVPHDLISTLEACAYAGPIRVGPASLSRLAEIDRENAEEENAACIVRGFLIVGSGLNGDPIAVELSSGKMAFISHDILWERTYDDFEECVVRTPLGFDEFWTAASESPNFPRDSYDAEKRWSSSTDVGDCAG